MTADSGWTEGEDRLPDGRSRTLHFIPTIEEKTAVLEGFLRLNISKGERKDDDHDRQVRG